MLPALPDKDEQEIQEQAQRPEVSLARIKKLAAGNERRLQILELMEQGMSIAEISQAVGIAPATVRNHITKLHEVAMMAGAYRLTEFKARKLVELEDMKERALREFELSCGQVTRARQIRDKKTGELVWLEETEFKAGDAKLLEAAGRAIERQAILVGAWDRGSPAGTNVQVNINNGVNGDKADFRVEIARAVMEQVKRIKSNPAAGAGAPPVVPPPVRPDVDRGAGVEEAEIVSQESGPPPEADPEPVPEGSIGWTPDWKRRSQGRPILPGAEGGPAPPKRGVIGPDGQIIPPEPEEAKEP